MLLCREVGNGITEIREEKMATGTQSGFFYWCDAELPDFFVIWLGWQETNYQAQGIEILLTVATSEGKFYL
jgi:hypothetical protein